MSRDGTLPPGVEHWDIEDAQEPKGEAMTMSKSLDELETSLGFLDAVELQFDILRDMRDCQDDPRLTALLNGILERADEEIPEIHDSWMQAWRQAQRTAILNGKAEKP